ncbi:hypothetical protein [Algoriphagus machipongonensis]|uniref:Secreted protein n=1 Tax=Algoriphagus machipongonensis TaxID=388413 RepID=A3HRZ0_9BACT|nr:hypothetical protein [Algoriphagus machipongonensis]EAZ82608.1 hypothetical protein ALPR1_10345 [Algoriphagus machipongonensis]
MKTLFTLALAGALSFSALANADDDLRALSDVNSNFKKINVLLKEGVGQAKIAILDLDGKKLHQKKVKVKNDDIMVPYNMDDLPCGEYLVMISTEDEEVVYTVETKEKPIPATELPLMAYGKTVDENTINLTVIGLTVPGVQVQVKTEKGGLVIHEEYIDQEDGFKKDFSFNGIDPEDIYLELTDALGRFKVVHF